MGRKGRGYGGVWRGEGKGRRGGVAEGCGEGRGGVTEVCGEGRERAGREGLRRGVERGGKWPEGRGYGGA